MSRIRVLATSLTLLGGMLLASACSPSFSVGSAPSNDYVVSSYRPATAR
ncbi:hypothetical protein [Roseococcus sp. YIM B11640]